MRTLKLRTGRARVRACLYCCCSNSIYLLEQFQLIIQEAIRENSFYGVKSEISVGDTDSGFLASTNVIEGEFSTGYQEHFYLEPHSTLVVPRHEFDEMEIHVTTQNLARIQVIHLQFCLKGWYQPSGHMT